jgi:asparagine synthase (glutamine-hydrolysing)
MQLIPENRVSNIGNKIRQAKKLLSSIDGSMEDNYINMISYNTVDIDNSISIDDKDSLNSVLKYDIKYYMNDNLLNLSDKMSMASSLEMRVPFLDYRLVNFSMTIDQKFKTNIYQKKIILKKLAEKYLDKNLIYRRKQGFSAPIEIWMKKRGKLYIESLINFNFLERFVNTDIINNDIEEFFDKNRDKSLQIYSYIVISIWYKLNKSFIYE